MQPLYLDQFVGLLDENGIELPLKDISYYWDELGQL
jgi:hypothetical protein